MHQLNFVLSEGAPEGCAVPLRLLGQSGFSQPVTISIRRGGGQCQDAKPARFGSLLWRKTVISAPGSAATSTSEAFTASFGEAPENQAVPLPDRIPRDGCYAFNTPRPPDPRCPGTAPKPLDAGVLTLQGLPGGPIAVQPAPVAGRLTYTATLRPGSIPSAPVRVAGAGGADIGAFETELSIPPPIQITTPLTPGTVILNTQDFRVTWTGGRPDALVRMQVIAHVYGPDGGFECAVLASDGEATLPRRRNPPIFPLPPNEDAEVVIFGNPMPAQIPTFTAPGLTRDARHEWSYEYHFKGLRIANQPGM